MAPFQVTVRRRGVSPLTLTMVVSAESREPGGRAGDDGGRVRARGMFEAGRVRRARRSRDRAQVDARGRLISPGARGRAHPLTRAAGVGSSRQGRPPPRAPAGRRHGTGRRRWAPLKRASAGHGRRVGSSTRRSRSGSRAAVPRGRTRRAARLAEFRSPDRRPDPVDLLEGQARDRIPELVPIRYGRMLVSPFTFYRGAALVMASDLATAPVAGVARAAVRGCPPLELRHLRHARAPAGVRHQRLRRDAPRAVRVGRQAARRQLRRRGPQPGLHPQRARRDRHGLRSPLPHGDGRVRGDGQPGRLLRESGRGAAAGPVPEDGGPRPPRQGHEPQRGARHRQGARPRQPQRGAALHAPGGRRAPHRPRPAAHRAGCRPAGVGRHRRRSSAGRAGSCATTAAPSARTAGA